MSLTLDRPVVPTTTARPAPAVRPAEAARHAPRPSTVPASPVAAATSSGAAAPARPRSVPEGTEARGFALYVGLDELEAAASGTSLPAVVAQLKELLRTIAPSAETHAAVALAPEGSGGRDVDVVRRALQDPSLRTDRRPASPEDEPGSRGGVVVDISRKRVLLDGDVAPLTYKEFELLQYLVLREGRTIERTEIVSGLWGAADDEAPNERTIDVHVRRLRSKLGAFEEIVRTVRGVGYRFDRHADVSIRQASTPSPDVF
ncbi:winged helix-turn-helix domain-containing protein [Frigoribacterium salinisoli]